jgi:creatinine amidohydrolase/Fe(II)-dependent formamide hydrolase-like protein
MIGSYVSGVTGEHAGQRTAMVTVKLDPEQANLEAAARALRLEPDDLDPEFGVVSLVQDEHLYVVLVDEKAAARAQSAEGVFSNPRIDAIDEHEEER